VSLSGVFPAFVTRRQCSHVLGPRAEEGRVCLFAGAACAGAVAEADVSAVTLPRSSHWFRGYECLDFESKTVVDACLTGTVCSGEVPEADVSAMTCLCSSHCGSGYVGSDLESEKVVIACLACAGCAGAAVQTCAWI
jgi:hypothetical protein